LGVNWNGALRKKNRGKPVEKERTRAGDQSSVKKNLGEKVAKIVYERGGGTPPANGTGGWALTSKSWRKGSEGKKGGRRRKNKKNMHGARSPRDRQLSKKKWKLAGKQTAISAKRGTGVGGWVFEKTSTPDPPPDRFKKNHREWKFESLWSTQGAKETMEEAESIEKKQKKEGKPKTHNAAARSAAKNLVKKQPRVGKTLSNQTPENWSRRKNGGGGVPPGTAIKVDNKS